jgi:hypothetical protein
MAKTGDKFVLHSSNGMDYKIEVVNVNNFRPQDEKYACDVWDCNGVYAGDLMFFGDDLLGQCEKVGD